LTGSADGKAAWDLLTQDGQSALKAHKLFGTYLLLASGIVLIFKLLSAMIQRGLMKILYMLILIFFVIGVLKQGKEGGELVYTHGANVKIVKIKDDELFDCKDDLSDYVAAEKEAEEEAAKAAEEAKKAEAAKAAEVTETAKVEAPANTETATEEKAEVPAAAEAETPEAKPEAPAVEAETPAPQTATETATEAPAEEAGAPEVEKVETASEPTPEIATH